MKRPDPRPTTLQQLQTLLNDVYLHAQVRLGEDELAAWISFGASFFARLSAERLDDEERPS